MGLLIAGTAVRLVPEVAPFFLGTLLIGVGIAVANVLVPIVIKRDYPRPATMMGLYTMVLISGAALAAGLTVPLERAVGSWQDAIALWGIAAVVAFIAWAPAVRAARGADNGPPAPRVRLSGDRLAWAVTVTSACSRCSSTSRSHGSRTSCAPPASTPGRRGRCSRSRRSSASPGLAAPMVAMRMTDQRPVIWFCVAFWLLGFGGLLAAPGSATPAWMVLLGLGQGTSFALALTLIVLRAPDAPHATALSGMAQGFGYMLAATGPFLAGALHDLTGGWRRPRRHARPVARPARGRAAGGEAGLGPGPAGPRRAGRIAPARAALTGRAGTVALRWGESRAQSCCS